jgi:hypothetical protein
MGAVTVTKPKPQPMSEIANEKTKQETGAASLDKAASAPAVDARERKSSANAAAPTSPSASAERGQALSYKSGAPNSVLQDALTQSAKDEVQRCGVVRDAHGKGLAGAQVAIADLGRVATTDTAGRFCISAPAGLHTVSAYGLRFTPLRKDATFGSGEGELVLVVEPVSVLPEQAKAVDSRAVLWPAAARRSLARARAQDSVARAPSAAAYERVAQSWQRVLDIVPSGSGTSDARDHLAEARFRAWETAPTAARAQAARAALDAYLASAPPALGAPWPSSDASVSRTDRGESPDRALSARLTIRAFASRTAMERPMGRFCLCGRDDLSTLEPPSSHARFTHSHSPPEGARGDRDRTPHDRSERATEDSRRDRAALVRERLRRRSHAAAHPARGADGHGARRHHGVLEPLRRAQGGLEHGRLDHVLHPRLHHLCRPHPIPPEAVSAVQHPREQRDAIDGSGAGVGRRPGS